MVRKTPERLGAQQRHSPPPPSAPAKRGKWIACEASETKGASRIHRNDGGRAGSVFRIARHVPLGTRPHPGFAVLPPQAGEEEHRPIPLNPNQPKRTSPTLSTLKPETPWWIGPIHPHPMLPMRISVIASAWRAVAMFRLRGGDAIERFGPAECCRPYSQREERVRGSVSAELSVTRDRAMNSPAFPPAAWGIQEVKHLRDPADDKRSRGRGMNRVSLSTGSRHKAEPTSGASRVPGPLGQGYGIPRSPGSPQSSPARAASWGYGAPTTTCPAAP
jgi:hypothetical protein